MSNRIRTGVVLVWLGVLPLDLRWQHYGEPVAGTGWKACKTDALAGGEATQIVRDRLEQELTFSKLFSAVDANPNADLQLKTQIHAFCAQAFGFVYLRVAGLTAPAAAAGSGPV